MVVDPSHQVDLSDHLKMDLVRWTSGVTSSSPISFEPEAGPCVVDLTRHEELSNQF